MTDFDDPATGFDANVAFDGDPTAVVVPVFGVAKRRLRDAELLALAELLWD